ncbi:MAG: type II secretion system F family protein [Pseudomonadota bacterium]
MARLLESGLPPDRALTLLADSSSAADRPPVEVMQRQLESGSGIGDSARRAGLLNESDAALVAAAEQSGNVDLILGRLATHYERRRSLARQVRARLALPAAFVVLAALIAPLPDLAANRYGAAGYAWRAFSAMAPPFGLAALAASAPVRARLKALLWPLAGRWFADYARRDYLETLSLALTSGLPAEQAIDLAAGTLPTRLRHGDAGSVKRRVLSGATVTDALHAAGLLTDRERALSGVGEFAGSLDGMLTRQVDALSDTLAGRERDVATWLPRIAYMLAAARAGAVVLSGL